MPESTPLTARQAAAWRMTQRYQAIRAEQLIARLRAESVLRLTDAVGKGLRTTNTDEARLLAEFASKRASALVKIARYPGASRRAGWRFAGALGALGLLKR